jgi:hypothetical protein
VDAGVDDEAAGAQQVEGVVADQLESILSNNFARM